MSKKIFLVFTAVLMALSFSAGKVIAAPAKDIAIETENNVTTAAPLTPSYIRVRAIFADSDGNLATEFGGFPINQAKMTIKSLNFGGEVKVAVKTVTEAVTQADFVLSGANAEISLGRAWQEFAVSYYDATEIGDDTLRITLKQTDPATLLPVTIVKDLPVTVTAPPANCYVVRTGGIPENQLPDLLKAIPKPKNNGDANLVSGQSVTIDVFAGFAYDDPSNGTGTADVILYTNNVPVGGIVTSYGTIDTTGRILATTKTVTGVGAGVDSDEEIATQVLDMAGLYQNGTTATFSGAVIGTRAIGNVAGDITTAGQINLNADISAIPATFVNTIPENTLFDTALYRTAPCTKINLIGMAVTDWQGGLVLNGAFFSINDLLLYTPDPSAKITDFNVSGDASTDAVYCALYGYDKNSNPAPFYQNSSTFAGAVASFQLLVTNDLPATTANLNGATIEVVDPAYGTYNGATGIVTTASALQSFLPLKITAGAAGGVLNLHVAPIAGQLYDVNILKGIDTIGTARNFRVLQGNVVSEPVAPFSGIYDAGGQDDVTISVQGTAQENSFQMRAEVQDNGSDVDVNVSGSSLQATTVNIPNTKDNKAEQDVSFYTTVENEPLRLTFVGLSKGTTFVYVTPVDVAIGPADPGDYPPKTVSAGFTKSIMMDAEEKHDEAVASGLVSITDAFDNAYAGTYMAAEATIEDAKPTIEVQKEDGTPFPGAEAEVDKNDVIVTFDRTLIAPDAQKAIVVITAGSGSDSFTINVRALQQTLLASIYQPVTGVTNTPVKLAFGDQNALAIPPDWRNTPQTLAPPPLQGAFEVDLEWVDGIIGLGETAIISTQNYILKFVAQPNLNKASMTIAADGRDAKAGETILTLIFGVVDTQPPVISVVEAGTCSIKVGFTDNVALDLAASIVKVSNADGDITSQLEGPIIEGDGTTEGSITYRQVPVGSYSLEIVAKDKAGNVAPLETRPATVATCNPGGCTSVEPAFAVVGTTSLDVTITGANTNFGATSVVTFPSCAGITVDSISATSLTTIVASISMPADVEACSTDVVVTTGLEIVTCANAFQLTTTLPSCVTVAPSSAKAGETKDVVITLADIDLTGKTITKDNVNFGCTGVTVNSATVNSATEITANITVAATATASTCDVTITGAGSVGIVCQGKFSVEVPVCELTVDPSTVNTGFLFPRTHTITITASEGCLFDASTTVTFSGNVTIVGDPVISGNTATVEIRTRPVILGGKGTNTLTVTTGTQTATATLTVKGLFF